MITVHKNVIRHDAYAPDEIDPSVLPRRQLVQIVIICDDGLGEQWAKADREREMIAIHRDTA